MARDSMVWDVCKPCCLKPKRKLRIQSFMVEQCAPWLMC